MTRLSPTVLSLVFAISSILPAHPQQAQTAAQTTATPNPPTAVHSTPAKREILVRSGTLKSISPQEADITTGDATLAFQCNENTRKDSAAPGDSVNILYVTNGSNNIALVVHLIQPATGTKGSPGEIGGVAKVEPATPFSLSPADAQSLQAKLEKDFGLAAADGSSAPAYGRVVVLQNQSLTASVSSVATPWNIYVNGTIETDRTYPSRTQKTSSTSSWMTSLRNNAIGGKPKPYEYSNYTLVPGAHLEVVKVSVASTTASNSAPAGRANDLVYTTLAFPIVSNDTPPAESINWQITQLLKTNSSDTHTASPITLADARDNNSSPGKPVGEASPTAAPALVAGIINGTVYINQGSNAGIKAADKFRVVRVVGPGLNDAATGTPVVQRRSVCILTIVSVIETAASGTCEGELPQSKDEVVAIHP